MDIDLPYNNPYSKLANIMEDIIDTQTLDGLLKDKSKCQKLYEIIIETKKRLNETKLLEAIKNGNLKNIIIELPNIMDKNKNSIFNPLNCNNTKNTTTSPNDNNNNKNNFDNINKSNSGNKSDPYHNSLSDPFNKNSSDANNFPTNSSNKKNINSPFDKPNIIDNKENKGYLANPNVKNFSKLDHFGLIGRHPFF